MAEITAKEVIEKLAKELGRLQKLCEDNGIDYRPPKMAPGASISVKASVKVFNTKEEADNYQKMSQ